MLLSGDDDDGPAGAPPGSLSGEGPIRASTRRVRRRESEPEGGAPSGAGPRAAGSRATGSAGHHRHRHAAPAPVPRLSHITGPTLRQSDWATTSAIATPAGVLFAPRMPNLTTLSLVNDDPPDATAANVPPHSLERVTSLRLLHEPAWTDGGLRGLASAFGGLDTISFVLSSSDNLPAVQAIAAIISAQHGELEVKVIVESILPGAIRIISNACRENVVLVLQLARETGHLAIGEIPQGCWHRTEVNRSDLTDATMAALGALHGSDIQLVYSHLPTPESLKLLSGVRSLSLSGVEFGESPMDEKSASEVGSALSGLSMIVINATGSIDLRSLTAMIRSIGTGCEVVLENQDAVTQDWADRLRQQTGARIEIDNDE